MHIEFMGNFTIRNAALSEMDFFLSLAKQEGWNPGLQDALPFYQTDPEGFFIGEIDGERLGCISAVTYDQSYGFMGFYIVIPKYRGKGFGLHLWNHAVNYLGNRCIGLDGVIDQQENYKKSHFQLHYRNMRFQGKSISSFNSKLTLLSQIPIKTVFEYDTKVFGLPRKSFLESWFKMSNACSLAKYEKGKLEGYGTIRKCVDGYKIGPLFAETLEVAEELFHGLCSKAHEEAVFLDVPDVNPQAMALANSFNLKKVFETARMYTKAPPAQQLNRIFGVTSFELG